MKVILNVTEGPHQGRLFEFTEHDTFIVGRSKDAHFRLLLKDKTFSRFHFMLEINPPSCRMLDMASTNGTFVNGKRVTTAELKSGDVILAGKSVLSVTVQAEDAPPEPIPESIVSAVQTKVPRVETQFRMKTDEPDGGPVIRPLPLLPGYRIEKEIGRGGMGAVYLAHDADGQAVAIKTVIPAVSGTTGVVARFLREASILRQLEHPRIIRFLSLGHAEGQLYFVMDYAPGTDGSRLVKRRGPRPIRQAVQIACQALEGLAYAHGKGFVHRDIKPHNLLLTKLNGGFQVKVADFGLARIYHNSPMSGLTMTGQVGGTIHYMPPEQVLDFREAKPSADQYSLAATLYFLLTGKTTHDYPTEVRKALLQILHHDPIPIRSRRPDIPESLAAIIHRAIDRDPRKRFRDANRLLSALVPFSA
jgi:pSer/pThr/pTyr-binding forkhead associated (FHA) protein